MMGGARVKEKTFPQPPKRNRFPPVFMKGVRGCMERSMSMMAGANSNTLAGKRKTSILAGSKFASRNWETSLGNCQCNYWDGGILWVRN